MTTTNEPATTPEVPAWLNLDAIAPPDIRNRLNHAAAAFEKLAAEVEQIAKRANAAMHDYEAGLKDLPDDMLVELRPLTGYERLYNAQRYISDLCAVSIGDKPDAYSFEWAEGVV